MRPSKVLELLQEVFRLFTWGLDCAECSYDNRERGGVNQETGKVLANPYPRTPAMAVGMSNYEWTVEQIVRLLD